MSLRALKSNSPKQFSRICWAIAAKRSRNSPSFPKTTPIISPFEFDSPTSIWPIGDYDSALSELKVLVDQGDQSSATLVKLARCFRLQGEVEEAKKLLTPLAGSKGEEAALRELADCQLELGEYAAAAQSLRDFGIERLPPAEQYDLALADYLSGKPESAASIYASATQVRQFQSRRAELEVYLLLNPDDEKARRELEMLNGQK